MFAIWLEHLQGHSHGKCEEKCLLIDDIHWLLNVFLLHLGWRREVEGGKSTDWKIVLHKVPFT